MRIERKQLGVMRRDIPIELRQVGDEGDRTFELAFSSEFPVRRFFGHEILDHKRGAMILDRAKGGLVNLLVDHRISDVVGIVEKISVGSDRVGRAIVRFGNSARASEILQDVNDGIRKGVSVGYAIRKMVLEEESEDGDIFRVVSWEPLEISIVPIPADPTVGFGRELDDDDAIETEIIRNLDKGTRDMPDDPNPSNSPDPANPTPAPVPASPAPAAPAVDPEAMRQEAINTERQRVAEIKALGASKNMTDFADEHVRQGTDLATFRGLLLERLPADTPLADPPSKLNMSDNDTRTYSVLKLLHAQANPNDPAAQRAAEFERECSAEIAKNMEKQPSGAFVPYDVQIAPVTHVVGGERMSVDHVNRALAAMVMQRDLSVGVLASGGYLVGTEHLGSSFIDLLRNAMKTRMLGARVLSGLVGDIAIPRQLTGSAAAFVAEAGALPESEPTFDQVPMSPKTIGAFTEFSRKLLRQSDPSVEMLVRSDLATGVGLKADQVGISGTGVAPEPRGVLNTTGIGDVAMADPNGGPPTWPKVVDIWNEVAIDNADFGSTAWLTNSRVIGKLMTTVKEAGEANYIVNKFPDAQGFTEIGGGRSGVSNQVPSTLTKGTGTNLSALIYGNWRDLLYGEWGTVDLLVNPFSLDTTGQIRVSIYTEMDAVVRRPQSFSASQDINTN